MKLFAWLLGPLSLREQLALPVRFLGWLFGRTIDVELGTSPANSAATDSAPRPKARPPRFCLALRDRAGKIVAIGIPMREPITPQAQARWVNQRTTLPLRAEVVVETAAIRQQRASIQGIQVDINITADGQVSVVPTPPASIDDLPHGAPPDAAMPTGYEPSAEAPPVWPKSHITQPRRAS